MGLHSREEQVRGTGPPFTFTEGFLQPLSDVASDLMQGRPGKPESGTTKPAEIPVNGEVANIKPELSKRG
jgi:hypothetical protein